MKNKLTLLIFITSSVLFAQENFQDLEQNDSVKKLNQITVYSKALPVDRLPEIQANVIFAGKKNEVLHLSSINANVATNNARQVFAKVPGVSVWENEGSGIQINIGVRGLSPNRSWEFNTRQNGYDISSDVFGYPEAYYNPPLQAVQRIEIVRGQGSLQYGPQFGGMINYILRNGSEIKKPFEFETQQTVGSNNMINSFNAIGGTKNKVHYYAFYDLRKGDGWRQNSLYNTNAGFATVSYQFTAKLSLTAEIMQSQIRSQQAGGLTDAQIKQDAQQSFRSRNWFDIKWTTPALSLDYNVNAHTRWNTKIYGTIGDRNSVGYLKDILTKDSINPATGEYNNRVLNIDQYRNYGLESRIITDYTLGGLRNTFSGGIRLYTGETWRRANGKGTTGINYDMNVIGHYDRDVKFDSKNAAAFFENMFRIGSKISIIPGLRYEWLEGTASGINSYTSAGVPVLFQNISRSRQFLLAGIGAEYHVSPKTEIYSSFAQAYRPIQFANLQAPPTTDIVDPNLKDAKGYNVDLGYRGKIKDFIQFDLSTFYLQYNNRVGTIKTSDGKNLITNVGASTSKGFEGLISVNIMQAINKNAKSTLDIFGSYSYTDARYSGNHKDANTKGKRVENAPENIFRGGINGSFAGASLGAQISYVGKAYSDANNTAVTSANAQNGIIPAYTLVDMTAGYSINKVFQLKGGINNLLDKRYFTRRSGGYPGPGALPGDGRTFFVSVAAKL